MFLTQKHPTLAKNVCLARLSVCYRSLKGKHVHCFTLLQAKFTICLHNSCLQHLYSSFETLPNETCSFWIWITWKKINTSVFIRFYLITLMASPVIFLAIFTVLLRISRTFFFICLHFEHSLSSPLPLITGETCLVQHLVNARKFWSADWVTVKSLTSSPESVDNKGDWWRVRALKSLNSSRFCKLTIFSGRLLISMRRKWNERQERR